MTPLEKMEQAKLQFNAAKYDLLLHLNEEKLIWTYESKLRAATDTYWEALYDLSENLPPKINPRYKKAIADLVTQLRSQVSFLIESVEEYRQQSGLET